MKITALLENTTEREDMLTEHGLSLYIETEKHKILFDMGQTGLFAQNAAALGIDLSAVDIAVLSHGHYDHGGGLKTFLEINQTAPVYLNCHAFEPHYHGTEKYIGLDISLSGSERLVFTDGTTIIGNGLTLCSCKEKVRKHSLISSGLNVLGNDGFLPEDFRHEQYLLVEEPAEGAEDGKSRTVLFSGCSHKGILDIADWFRPDVLIGGFHFSKLPLDDTLKSFAEYLDAFRTEYYTCHCTGRKQFAFMEQYMRGLHYLSCGQSIELFP